MAPPAFGTPEVHSGIMPAESSTIFLEDEAEGSDDGNTLANSRVMTRSTRSLRSSHAFAHGQVSAISEQLPVGQYETAESRKRNHVESEDELTGSAKHPRTRTYSATEVENWETVFIGIASRLEPEAVRALLDNSRSQIKRQRSKIAHLVAIIQQEREIHEGFEKHQKENYAALEKKFRAHKNKMASILTANVEAFGPKVSDDTIVGEWKQLHYKVQNIVCSYLTNTSPPGTSADCMFPMRDILFRRQLWVIICFHCFSGRMEHCYGGIGQSLALRIDQIDPCAPPSCQFLKMISNMKSAFDPDIKEDGRLNEDFEQNQAITDATICFDDGIPHEQKEVFKRDIGEIIKQAVNLHLAMLRSKAIFVVQWAANDMGEDDCRYDPETMIPLQDGIDTTSSSYAVDFNESPAVWKIGNADGENFDSVMVLCKSVVVVKEQNVAVVLE